MVAEGAGIAGLEGPGDTGPEGEGLTDTRAVCHDCARFQRGGPSAWAPTHVSKS